MVVNAHPRFLKSKNITIIKTPLSLGQSLEGVNEAPDLLLQNGLAETIASLGWEVERIQTVAPAPHIFEPLGAHQPGINIRFPRELGRACGELAGLTKQSARDRQFTLTLGGDHSIAIGSIGGMLKEWSNLGVIWVDAHGDFNTPETSPSGNIHGMPLAFLTGLMKPYALREFSWLRDFLPRDRLVLVGIRSIDPEERRLMKNFGVHVFSMTEIDRYGIGGVMEQALAILSQNGDIPLHLSYDIDAVDPHFAPSTGTRVRGGLNYREAHFIAERVAETGLLVGMDLVEINPRLGYLDPALRNEKNLTVEVGIELIGSALGKRIY